MGSSDSQIDKPQSGRPKRAELPDVKNVNTGALNINTGLPVRLQDLPFLNICLQYPYLLTIHAG